MYEYGIHLVRRRMCRVNLERRVGRMGRLSLLVLELERPRVKMLP